MDGLGPLVLTYLGFDKTTTGTDLSFSFGPSNAKRHLIACVGTGQGATSVTIGGVSATELVRQDYTGLPGATGIYIAAVPAGISGVVAISNINDIRACALYSAVNLQNASAYDTDQVTGAVTPLPFPMSIDIPARGFTLQVAFCSGDPSITATWTGITADVDNRFSIGSRNSQFSAGHIESTTATTANTTVTWGGGALNAATCCAVSLR